MLPVTGSEQAVKQVARTTEHKGHHSPHVELHHSVHCSNLTIDELELEPGVGVMLVVGLHGRLLLYVVGCKGRRVYLDTANPHTATGGQSWHPCGRKNLATKK